MSRKKRQRKNTVRDVAVSGPTDYLLLIGSLSTQTMSNILHNAAKRHPDVARSIVNERNNMSVAERAGTPNLDLYSKRAWNILNVKYSNLRFSQQFEKASDATSEVLACIDAIGKATLAHSNFSTKKNALETLWEIGRSICLGGEELGREVRKRFQHDSFLQETMLQIVRRLTMEEENALMTQEFVDKLKELEELSSGYCVFENLKDVRLALLREQEFKDGETDDEEDEDDEMDADEEEQDEDEDDETDEEDEEDQDDEEEDEDDGEDQEDQDDGEDEEVEEDEDDEEDEEDGNDQEEEDDEEDSESSDSADY